jgi:hypothetical protein
LVGGDRHEINQESIGRHRLQVGDHSDKFLRSVVEDQDEAEPSLSQAPSQALGEGGRVEGTLLVISGDGTREVGIPPVPRVASKDLPLQNNGVKAVEIGRIGEHLGDDRPACLGVAGELDFDMS